MSVTGFNKRRREAAEREAEEKARQSKTRKAEGSQVEEEQAEEVRPDGGWGDEGPELNQMSRNELVRLAKAEGVPDSWRMKKDELVKALGGDADGAERST